MPQLTVYIDDKTLKGIESAAKSSRSSISKWVKLKLAYALHSSWPEGFFDLLGSLKNSGLKRPKKLKFSKDTRRVKL